MWVGGWGVPHACMHVHVHTCVNMIIIANGSPQHWQHWEKHLGNNYDVITHAHACVCVCVCPHLHVQWTPSQPLPPTPRGYPLNQLKHNKT